MAGTDVQQSLVQRFSNPTRFMGWSGALLPWIGGLTALVIVAGLYAGLVLAPPDYQQGETVRIMFVHVPAAWLAMFTYLTVVISSIGFLVWRHPLADVSAKAAVPLGAVFTLLALVTGSLWGRPMWGTYWVWDARLTSVLILFFLYLGLMALRNALEDELLAGKLTAMLAIVGVIILPVIKFSVDWWATLHQPASVLRADGPTLHPTILWPLLVMAVGFSLLFMTMHLIAMRNEVRRRRILSLQRARASRPAVSAEAAGGTSTGGTGVGGPATLVER
ncbi:MAG: heme ABC transporter permease [Pseudomonadota bacterium]